MGGAQPLAATMAGASMLAVECQPSRIERRLRDPLCRPQGRRRSTRPWRSSRAADAKGKAVSVGLLGNAAEIFPELVAAAASARPTSSPTRPAPTTRSTATCRPAGRSTSGERTRASDPTAVGKAAKASMAVQVARHAGLPGMGIPTLDYGNNIRQMALEKGVRTPSTFRASCRPISGRCSAAASARSAGWRCPAIPRTSTAPTRKVKELIPDNPHLHNWLDMARERIAFQGLPARICWVGLGDRHRLGLAFNEMVAKGEAEGADRHRPRPPRFRLGRQPQPSTNLPRNGSRCLPGSSEAVC